MKIRKGWSVNGKKLGRPSKGPKPPLLRDLYPWAPRLRLKKCVNPLCRHPTSKHHSHGLCLMCHDAQWVARQIRAMGPEGFKRYERQRKAAYRARKKAAFPPVQKGT